MPRTTPALLILALGYAALELGSGWVPPWELFHDELYYWAGSRRLELGYVDHPPLAPWVLAGVVALLGEGRLAFGLPMALCGAGTVFLTGAMARRLGADTFGQLLAGLGAAVAPVPLIFFSFYSVNAIEILLWTSACFLLLELIRTGDERLWLAIGAVAGLGLLNKHTFVLIGFGIAIGVLATPLRAQLRSRWLWLGAGLALLLASPNLWWNFQNDWPSLDFYQSRGGMNLPTSLALRALRELAPGPADLGLLRTAEVAPGSTAGLAPLRTRGGAGSRTRGRLSERPSASGEAGLPTSAEPGPRRSVSSLAGVQPEQARSPHQGAAR